MAIVTKSFESKTGHKYTTIIGIDLFFYRVQIEVRL